MLADESVAEVDVFQELADAHHEAEVNRPLIWAAIAKRQLLDIEDAGAGQTCGRLWPDLHDPASERDLTFREACNKIIHAVEIVPYGLGDDPATMPDRARYEGRITIRGGWRGRNTHTVIDSRRFAEYCAALSSGFLSNTLLRRLAADLEPLTFASARTIMDDERAPMVEPVAPGLWSVRGRFVADMGGERRLTVEPAATGR